MWAKRKLDEIIVEIGLEWKNWLTVLSQSKRFQNLGTWQNNHNDEIKTWDCFD